MHRPLTVAILVLALGACGQEKGEPKSPDEVIAEAGKMEKPRPGQYETSVELIDFSVPGLPPQQADQIRSMMGGVAQQKNTYCLTPAEADKGYADSVRKMTEGTGQMKCDFNKFDVDGGELDATLTCTGPQGMNAEIALDGKGGAESSQMHMKMVQKSSMIPGGEMRMEMQMASKRVGDCAA